MVQSTATPAQVTDKWGRAVPQPTAQQMATTKQVLSQMQPSPLIPHQHFLHLDLSDPLHKQFFDDRFGHLTSQSAAQFFPSHAQLVNHMVQTSPMLKAAPSPMLNGATAASTSYQPTAIISLFDYDTTGSNQVTAAGLVSVPNGVIVSNCVMEILQNDTMIAQGSGSSYGTYATAANATGTQNSVGSPLTAILTGYYATSQGATAVPFMVKQSLSPVPKLNITVTNPVHTVTTSPNPITVALGRYPSGGPQDTDYYYNQNQPGNNELEIAVTGTATPASPSDQFNPATAVTGSLILLRQNGSVSGGGKAVFPGDLNKYCQVTPAQLSWTLNPADFQQSPPPWSPGDIILLNLSLTVAMNGNTPVVVTVTSDQSGNIVGQQPQNTAFIDALMFYWGCLAGETLIEMADGSHKAVRDIAVGERVRSHNGTWLQVHSAKLGREAKPMIEIECGAGVKALMTDGHPVLTENGLKAARDLAAGDAVRVAGGYATIHSVSAVSYDGMVHNLTLVDENGDFPDQAAFLAGGLWVGDDRMQTKVEQASLDATMRSTDQHLSESLKGWELDMENHRRLLAGAPLLSLLP